MPKAPPRTMKPNNGLAFYWNKPVSKLAEVATGDVLPPDAERHTIYSLLTMSLVSSYWNGNKLGAMGSYPWREKQMITAGRYNGDQFGDRYIGHNIACIAVDENGEVMDFEFNHNELYNSSMEHAEARLIRRIFSLNQIYDHWQAHATGETRFIKYGNVFNGVTIYTSLESCAQCSGIMALASCLRVVFLQNDPGQSMIGNMLYNLTRPVDLAEKIAYISYTRPSPAKKYWAPEPLNAVMFGFKYKEALDAAYLKYVERVTTDESMYFYQSQNPKPKSKPDRSTSITSFLCTDLAMEIFQSAATELETISLSYPNHRPARSDGKVDGVFSNAEALNHVRAFLHHAITEARRGTPHR